MTEPGTRVLAVRNADSTERKVYVFGYGVYEGNFPRPGSPKEIPKKDADLIRSLVVKGDREESREENHSWQRKRLAAAVADGKKTQEEADKAYLEYLETDNAHHARPVEERVLEVWKASLGNPRIKLDDGGYCWGFESWWGPAEEADKHFEGYDRVQVAPQYGEAE